MNAVTAELRKFFTTRMWWGMGIAVVLSGMGLAALNGLFLTSSAAAEAGVGSMSDSTLAKNVYTGGIGVGYLLTLAVGVMAIGAEYRHKTITSTFLATPKRVRVMVAKVVALVAIGGFYGVLSLLGSTAVGATILSLRGHPAFPDASVWRSMALGLLVLAVWALIGLGAGILIPNQVAALLVSIGVAWIVEPILTFVFGAQDWGKGFVRFFPSAATTAALDTNTTSGPGSIPVLAWWGGALVLVGYAAVMSVVGSALTVRRDVS
ncbi:MAG: ABC transporter permease [Dermatophilaceae bacterium]